MKEFLGVFLVVLGCVLWGVMFGIADVSGPVLFIHFPALFLTLCGFQVLVDSFVYKPALREKEPDD